MSQPDGKENVEGLGLNNVVRDQDENKLLMNLKFAYSTPPSIKKTLQLVTLFINFSNRARKHRLKPPD